MRSSRLLLASLLALGAAGSVQAASEGDWILRVGATNVAPNDKSGEVAGIAGSELAVENEWGLGFTVGYMLTDNTGVEVMGASPFEHEVRGNDVLADAGFSDIGRVEHLPPNIVFQYHFNNDTALKPYLGVGVNYTWFRDADSNVPGLFLDFDDSWGLAGQVGLDYQFDDSWLATLDLRYLDIGTDVTLTGIVQDEVDLDIDPWVFTVALGVRF